MDRRQFLRTAAGLLIPTPFVIPSYIREANARFQVNQLAGFGTSFGHVEISHTASASDASDLTTYTFSSQSLGSANSNRFIVVGAGGRATANGRTISSMTIAGVSAAEIIKVSADDTTLSRCAGIFGAVVPTGTTGDVVVTFSGAMVRAGIGVWRLVGLTTTTAHDTQTDTAGDPVTMTLDVPVEGVGVGVVFSNTTGFSWSGLDEDFEVAPEGNTISGGSKQFPSGDSAVSVSVTHGGTKEAGVCASWGPH